jgi:hypothetical protein
MCTRRFVPLFTAAVSTCVAAAYMQHTVARVQCCGHIAAMEGKVTCMSVPYFFLLPSTKEGRSPRVSVEVHVDFYRNPWAAALASIVVKAPESGGQFEWAPFSRDEGGGGGGGGGGGRVDE